jgi:hypothetical protein
MIFSFWSDVDDDVNNIGFLLSNYILGFLVFCLVVRLQFNTTENHLLRRNEV